jgi:hypothetical protein
VAFNACVQLLAHHLLIWQDCHTDACGPWVLSLSARVLGRSLLPDHVLILVPGVLYLCYHHLLERPACLLLPVAASYRSSRWSTGLHNACRACLQLYKAGCYAREGMHTLSNVKSAWSLHVKCMPCAVLLCRRSRLQLDCARVGCQAAAAESACGFCICAAAQFDVLQQMPLLHVAGSAVAFCSCLSRSDCQTLFVLRVCQLMTHTRRLALACLPFGIV